MQLRTAPSVPLPTNLDGLSMTFNGIEGAIFGAFDGLTFDQANVQVPWNLDVGSGGVDVRLRWTKSKGNVVSNTFRVNAAEASPGIFTFDFGPGRAIVQNLDGSFAQTAGSLGGTAAQPAVIGGVVIIWAQGLGPVNIPVATGDVPGFDSGGNAILPVPTKGVRVLIGGIPALAFPVLHPTLVGVNQINAVVPAGVTPGGAVPIVIEVDCGGGKILTSRSDVFIAVAAGP